MERELFQVDLTRKTSGKFVQPERSTRSSILKELKRCSRMRDLEKGKKIHQAAVKNGRASNIFVASSLVDMYAKCGDMIISHRVFDRMSQHNVVAWTALILGYADSGQGHRALDLFYEMQSQGCIPNSVTFVAALKACVSLAYKEEPTQLSDGKLVKMNALEEGMQVHLNSVVISCEREVKVACTLIDMYAKCGTIEYAYKVFQGVNWKDAVPWTTLMLGHANNGEGTQALRLFHQMVQEGCLPDRVTYIAALKACISLAEAEEGKQVAGKLVKLCSLEKAMHIHLEATRRGCEAHIALESTLIDLYAKCRVIVDSSKVFDGMSQHDVVSWTALLLGCIDNGDGESAIHLFRQMSKRGHLPDAHAYAAALKACGMVGALDYGKQLHGELQCRGFEQNVVVSMSLMDFYGRCWSMVDAQQVFDSLREKGLKEWTALLTGYSRQGDTGRVFDLFNQMQDAKIKPDGIALLCVLTACSHCGLVDKAMEYFESMEPKYQVKPGIEHYTCMADMLGRAGKLEDAVQLLKGMSASPNAVTWMAVLSACQKWKNVEVGELAFRSLLSLDHRDSAAYVLMADIYESRGMLEEGCKN